MKKCHTKSIKTGGIYKMQVFYIDPIKGIHYDIKYMEDSGMSIALSFCTTERCYIGTDSRCIRTDIATRHRYIDDHYKKIHYFPDRNTLIGITGKTTFQTEKGWREIDEIIREALNLSALSVCETLKNITKTLYLEPLERTNLHVYHAEDGIMRASYFELSYQECYEVYKVMNNTVRISGIPYTMSDQEVISIIQHPFKAIPKAIQKCIDDHKDEQIAPVGGAIQFCCMDARGKLIPVTF